MFYLIEILCSLLIAGSVFADSMQRTVLIPGGSFTPLYSASKKNAAITVKPFKVDTIPVTNEDFFGFTLKSPQWQKGGVSTLLADSQYLRHWVTISGKPAPKSEDKKRPVTFLSWFAAESYCESRRGRLPTTAEWEFVAAANQVLPDASHDPAFVEQLLSWYARPNTAKLPNVGLSQANFWGVRDLHGLVWEWVADFNSVFIAGDSRRDGDNLKGAFCGAGVESASDRANYAAFMRYALRSSLQGSYTLGTLGFRCVYDL